MNRKVRDTLSQKPFCRLVTNDVYQISKRIKGIDRNYFILYNTVNKKYEVHNTENIGSTYCFTVQDDKLDYRTLKYCRRTSTGRNSIATVEKQNGKIDRLKEKQMHNDIKDRAADVGDRMVYATDSYKLHDGYRRVHSFS